MLEARASRVRRRPTSVTVEPAACAPARGGRRPGRLLLRGAAARRRGARPRQRPHHPRPRRQPAAHRVARRARADGRARLGLQPAPRRRREPVASVQVQHAENSWRRRSAPARCRVSSTSCRSSRSSPRTRAARRVVRGAARAAREGERPHRGGHRRPAARSAPASTRGPTAGRSPASRRGCAAAGSTRAATTGSPCSAPSRGSRSREGVEIEGADTAAISFPGFYELLESVTRR